MSSSRIAIIGLGDNQKNIAPAVCKCDRVVVAAVCDIDPAAKGCRYYKDAAFYADFHELVAREQVDYFYIATNPETHYEIARDLLESGGNVLCEKPPCTTFCEFEELEKIASENNAFFNIVYHFRFSNEALWLKRNIHRFGKLRFSEARFHDPYLENGNIVEDRVALRGCWMDSASNILSVWSDLNSELSPSVIGEHIVRDVKYALPIETEVMFESQGVKYSTSIRWTQYNRDKQMSFLFDDAYVLLDFTAQKVFLNGRLECEFGIDRSTPHHYENFFSGFDVNIASVQNDATTEFLYSVT